MDIVKQNIDELGALLKVQIVKNDYEENVKKSLNNYRKKAEIKGFRPGMAPMSLIQKMYGHSVLIDEINKIISESLGKYIEDEKLEIVGEPIPCDDEQKQIDWSSQSDFEFVYEIGYAPKYELKINKLIKIPYYNIAISDDDTNRHIEEICKRYATFTNADEIADNDYVKVDLEQQDGISVSDSYISLRTFEKDEQKAMFLGLKVGDAVKVNINELYDDDKHKATLLKISNEEIAKINPVFNVTVKEIKTLKNAEINQELFDMAYGKDSVKNEEEFLQRINSDLSESYRMEGEYKFAIDIREKLVAKADLKFPEAFLKKWLLLVNENKLTAEQIDKDFDAFLQDLCWDTISNSIAKENEINVTDDDIKAEAIVIARQQLRQYGLSNLPDDEMEGFAQRILSDKRQLRGIVDRALGNKVVAFLKTAVKLDEKTVSFDEFIKLLDKK